MKRKRKKESTIIVCSEDLDELEEYLKGTDLPWSYDDEQDCAVIEILIYDSTIPDDVWKAYVEPDPEGADINELTDFREEQEIAFCKHFGIDHKHVAQLMALD